LQHAIGYRSPGFAQDMHHVIGGAATGAHQYHFHRPRPQVATATLRCAVNHQRVATARLGDKTDVFNPLDACFHGYSRDRPWKMRRKRYQSMPMASWKNSALSSKAPASGRKSRTVKAPRVE